MMKNEIQYLLNTGSCSNHKFVCPQGPCGDSEGCDRFIPIFGGAHNRFNKYEECTLVYDPETLVAYISKRCVPTGVEITNRKYWQPMNVSGYADDNIIIFSDRNQAGQLVPYTLETAVPCVEISGRKNGTIISFYSTTNIPHWEIWQYQNSDTCHWEELQYWKLVTNIYNKFVGWYNNLDELESIPVNDRVGKYALIGDTLIGAHIYKGTRYGWIDTGLNIYQKFFDDVCQEGTVTLTEEQKKFFCNLIGALFKDDLVNELVKIFNNYEDYPSLIDALRNLFSKLFKWLLDHLDQFPDIKTVLEQYFKTIIDKYGSNEVTNFEIISHINGIGDFNMKYPTSIYSDCSKMITYNDTVGRKNESILEVPEYFTNNLDLKFTAGVWKGITNNGEEYCLCGSPTRQAVQAEYCCGENPWGFLRFDMPTYPAGMKVIVDDGNPMDYYDGFGVICDGGSHVIEFIQGEVHYNVSFHYYKAPATGSYVGEEIVYNVSVVAGEILDPTHIITRSGDTELINTGLTNQANDYKGHNFTGWATNYKKYNTSGLNPYTDLDAIHSYNVVGKSNVNPQYFDFSTPINQDIDLYAWYNIPVTIYWEDTESHTQNSCYNYGSTIKAYKSPYEGSTLAMTNGGNSYYTYPMLPDVEKQDYTLKGWTYNSTLYPGKVGPITMDGLVQATFDKIITYTVKFNANGGSPTPATQTIVRGQKVSEPVEPTKDGYTFIGWYNGNNLYNFNDSVNSNLTLTAKWEENEPDINTSNYTLSIVNGLESTVKVRVTYYPTDSNLNISTAATRSKDFTIEPHAQFSLLTRDQQDRNALSNYVNDLIGICVDPELPYQGGEGNNFTIQILSNVRGYIDYGTGMTYSNNYIDEFGSSGRWYSRILKPYEDDAIEEWREVSGYECDENTHTKYSREELYINGEATGETRIGKTVLERNSEECGYEEQATSNTYNYTLINNSSRQLKVSIDGIQYTIDSGKSKTVTKESQDSTAPKVSYSTISDISVSTSSSNKTTFSYSTAKLNVSGFKSRDKARVGVDNLHSATGNSFTVDVNSYVETGVLTTTTKTLSNYEGTISAGGSEKIIETTNKTTQTQYRAVPIDITSSDRNVSISSGNYSQVSEHDTTTLPETTLTIDISQMPITTSARNTISLFPDNTSLGATINPTDSQITDIYLEKK